MKFKLVILLSGLALLVAASCTPGTVLTTGAVAPAFELFDTGRNTISLAGYAGRPVMLNFWGTN